VEPEIVFRKPVEQQRVISLEIPSTEFHTAPRTHDGPASPVNVSKGVSE